MVIGLCRMFPALHPESALRADARLLRMADVWHLAHPPQEGGELQ
jgi:hypothetical protein